MQINSEKKNILGIKTIFQDLKTLPRWFKIALLIGAILVVFFSFFSIETYNPADKFSHFSEVEKWYGTTHFSPFQQYAKAFTEGTALNGGIGGSKNAALLATVFYSLNGIAAFTGILSVGMITFGKKSQFFWGMINGLFYSLFALIMGMTGDFVMNLIFVLVGPFGWYWFTFIAKDGKTIRIYKVHKRLLIVTITLIIIALSIASWYYFIPWFHQLLFGNGSYQAENIKHWFDATANGINFIGYWMQIGNFSEQFWIWMFVDILKIIIYTPVVQGQFVITILIQFLVWTSFTSYGLYQHQISPMIDEIKIYMNSKKEKQIIQ